MKNIIIENVYNTIVVHRLAINKCSLFAAPNFDSKITCYNNKLNSQQMSRTCVIKWKGVNNPSHKIVYSL